MAPYEGLSSSVSEGRSDDSVFEAKNDVPSYVNGQADSDDSDQQAPIENASDIADLKSGLQLSPKHIPCGYLYNDRGSQLYEEITKLEEYYPFETEKELLSQHASQIVSSIPAGSIIVELGCGNAEKTSVLLHALISRYESAYTIEFALPLSNNMLPRLHIACVRLHAYCMHTCTESQIDYQHSQPCSCASACLLFGMHKHICTYSAENLSD